MKTTRGYQSRLERLRKPADAKFIQLVQTDDVARDYVASVSPQILKSKRLTASEIHSKRRSRKK